MKGISTIIATIILVVITISLVSTAYLFVGGVLTGSISKVISLVDAKAHRIIVRNDGTDTIASDEISVSVNGQEVVPINTQDIEPQDTVTLRFVPPELDMRSVKVVVSGPSNTLSYTTDIVPKQFKVIDGTVGLWHFNGNSNDETGVNNGALFGDAYYTPDGKFGFALELDGSDDYVNCGNDVSLDLTGAFTIEGWFKHSSGLIENPNNWYGGIEKDQAYHLGWQGWTDGWSIYVYSGGVPNFKDSVDSYMPAGEWHHIAAVYDIPYLRIYRDGVEIASQDIGTLTIDSNANALMIGYVETSYWEGIIDEVHILNRALKQEEILDNMYG